MVKAVTLADVAREAGVSAKTVSNVINNTGRVGDDTRRNIEAIIERLGYRVNRSAAALRSGTTKLIGLAVPGFTNPFFGLFCDAVARCVRDRGYGLVISTYGDCPDGIEDLIDETYHINADGWVFLTDRPLRDKGAVLRQSYPVVLTGDFPAYGKVDSVTMPDTEGAEYAVNWLFANGCERVAFVGAPPDLAEALRAGRETADAVLAAHPGNMSMRMRGYLSALRANGRELDLDLVGFSDFMAREDGFAAAMGLMERGAGFDGVFCANDILALGVLSALRLRHVCVPGDVQVVGFDNTRDSEHSMPSLTTVDPFVWQYAQIAVDRLIRRIEGDGGGVGLFTTGFRLVERDSTRRASAGEPAEGTFPRR